jgi:hypothetical protein
METKKCSKCGEVKDVSGFGVRKLKSGNTQVLASCRICGNKATARWRAANPEKVKAARENWDDWRAENPERVKAAKKDWYAANREKIINKARVWAEANPEKRKATSRKWYEKNFEMVNSYSAAQAKANPERARAIQAAYRERLSDNYVASRLCTPNPPQELIELKRLTMQIKRELKQQEQSK